MKKKILLVEDNESNQELFREIIKTTGKYELFIVDSGPKALEFLEQTKPDLILMDIHMPHLDGLAVTRKIKSNPSLAHIPIVALSALAREKDRQAAMEAGCAGYITKPIRIKRFLEQLDKFIEEGSNHEDEGN